MSLVDLFKSIIHDTAFLVYDYVHIFVFSFEIRTCLFYYKLTNIQTELIICYVSLCGSLNQT